jgi:hypothetical protein
VPINCSKLKLVDVTRVISFYNKSARLYLGDRWAPQAFSNPECDAVLSVGSLPRRRVAIGVDHVKVQCEDGDSASFFRMVVDMCLPFLHSQLLQGKRVLVHCYMGMSRSPLVVTTFALATRSRSVCPCDVEERIRRIIIVHVDAEQEKYDKIKKPTHLIKSIWKSLSDWDVAPTRGNHHLC